MLSVIIVTYRSVNTIGDCLESLRRACRKIGHEIIVVDNASSDETVAYLKQHEKEVRIIQNKKNVGFARAVNQGLKVSKGDQILFLNPDVMVGERSIAQLIKELNRRGDIGIVGPKFQYPNGKLQASFGNEPSFFTELMQLFWLYRFLPWGRVIMPGIFTGGRFMKSHFVDWVSGGCLLIRGELARELKGFDEHFFMYLEDIDLCLRARARGFLTSYLPTATITHIHRASFHGKFTLGNLLEAKSVMYFLQKWYGQRASHTIIRFLLKSKFFIKLLLARIWLERGKVEQFNDYWRAWREI